MNPFEAAINVLDTDEGISEDFYEYILVILPENEAAILTEKVEATDGCFYLHESDAFEIRNEFGFEDYGD